MTERDRAGDRAHALAHTISVIAAFHDPTRAGTPGDDADVMAPHDDNTNAGAFRHSSRPTPSYAQARDRACSCRDDCRATSRTMRTGVRPSVRPALRCAAQSGARDNHTDDGCARRASTWRHADNDARVPARTIARTEQLWRGAQAQQRVSSSSSLYWLQGCSTVRVHKAHRDERRPRIGRRNGATK